MLLSSRYYRGDAPCNTHSWGNQLHDPSWYPTCVQSFIHVYTLHTKKRSNYATVVRLDRSKFLQPVYGIPTVEKHYTIVLHPRTACGTGKLPLPHHILCIFYARGDFTCAVFYTRMSKKANGFALTLVNDVISC